VSGRLRVQLIHGLEGSPTGAKAQHLGRHFDLFTPAMDTRDFEGAIRTQADALAAFCPDVLVGSSFGGAVALALVQRGSWRADAFARPTATSGSIRARGRHAADRARHAR
jgi:hypothetical protein